VPYVRTVKTSSGATAVQIVYSSHRGSRQIEHLGSAHDGAGVELLKAMACKRTPAGRRPPVDHLRWLISATHWLAPNAREDQSLTNRLNNGQWPALLR